ncbi:aldolase catalytic domain-containing protein [Garicola koreensis]|uniref:4-hydroxy 2-oxovalerate aldolase n=1 Tax=Garicola koreensis TaxID=1262554 RepID=A0A7W5U1Q4_9MICC|nr:aldolase catalytic domain-containing protein [Garicola koreensis]MBB3667606.1 4-hydroxy 2-oxovalerate aldolase [Garicola koreensis]
MIFLDCTLRDGGYYNAWDFPEALVLDYLDAMKHSGVDAVELGLRSLKTTGFAGASAYTTDDYLRGLPLPTGLMVGVMVNAAELVGDTPREEVLERLFPASAEDSPVDLVRIASHVHEFEQALPAVNWLKTKGYKVGFNLMQVADRSEREVKELARKATQCPMDALYFADSFGSMSPDQAAQIIQWMRSEWDGPLGIHTHENMGLALSNVLRAIDEGVTWVDATVTGMGRGPGNAKTEEVAIEMAALRGQQPNLVPLMSLIRKHFKPMQKRHGWGKNPYYYLAGKYGIHPTYIQTMLSDSRYDEEDVLSVINHLRSEGGKKYNATTLENARHFYGKAPRGSWRPTERFSGREVLVLGAGPAVHDHQHAIESFIRRRQPLVVALNTQSSVSADLIDLRVASHPVRLLADSAKHAELPQPLVAPVSMLPDEVRETLDGQEVLDFGLSVDTAEHVSFGETHCVMPSALVIGYALALATSGSAERILLAGFDGYGAGDPRDQEMQSLIEAYQAHADSLPLTAITPTHYGVHTESVYAL